MDREDWIKREDWTERDQWIERDRLLEMVVHAIEEEAPDGMELGAEELLMEMMDRLEILSNPLAQDIREEEVRTWLEEREFNFVY